jgi:hypothetical protein
MIDNHTELVLKTTAKALEPHATDLPVKTRPAKAPHGRRIKLMRGRPVTHIRAVTRYGYDAKGNAL